MVYSSLPFLFVFLPCLLLAYFAATEKLRNPILVLASLLFYAWGGMDFFAILIAFIITHWAAGCGVQKLRDLGRMHAMWIVVGFLVAGDVSLIGWYKYANFTVDQSNTLATWLGWAPPFPRWQHILLPIGISFFTFQAISYLVDIANAKVRALANPVDFALYKALFPQLIAGPIVRYVEVADQIKSRTITWESFNGGLLRLAHGVAKKVLIADPVSQLADAAFAQPAGLTTVEAWIGAIAYSIQIYFDFSGYSDMAIGLGRMFGFRFPENFNRPYAATSVTDFWRRWHMTLSRWFRDYLYIPLGGSRTSAGRTYLNLLIVFFATGLWHGANWTFIVWGLWHGGWLMLERAGVFAIDPGQRPWLQRARMLLAVVVGWVFFRADSLGEAGRYLATMSGFGAGVWGVPDLLDHLWWQPVAALALGTWIMVAGSASPLGLTLTNPEPTRGRAITAGLCTAGFAVSVLSLVSGSASPFLYFRF